VQKLQRLQLVTRASELVYEEAEVSIHREASAHWSLRIRTEAEEVNFTLNDAYARLVTLSGKELRVHATVPDSLEGLVGFSVTADDVHEHPRQVLMCDSVGQVIHWLENLRRAGCIMADFAARFDITGVIDTGATSVVYSAVGKGAVARGPVAVKCFSDEQYRSEAAWIFSMRHPNVIGAHGLYDVNINHQRRWILVLDHADGGVLSNYLGDTGMPESQAQGVFKQLIPAVVYIHSLGIVHRDIKMENVLCRHRGDDMQVILSDFGLAARVDNKAEMHRCCGTPGYIAPEMLYRKFDECGTLVDCFSLGVLLYFLLTGCSPFVRADPRETAVLNAKAVLPLQLGMSPAGQELVVHLCARNPQDRILAAEVMHSIWMAPAIRRDDDKTSSSPSSRDYSSQKTHVERKPLGNLPPLRNANKSIKRPLDGN
jgi:calcium/calmodulin-dependent protein kinase I